MADGARSKELQETLRKLHQIESMKREAAKLKSERQLPEMNSHFNSKNDHLSATTQPQLLNLDQGKGASDEPKSVSGNPPPTAAHFTTEIGFPRFDGSNPRSWITKCTAYFKLFPHFPDSQRVALAYLHFEGKASLWLQTLPSEHDTCTWSQFLEAVCARFEKPKDAIEVVGEFRKLRQTGSYLEYVETFQHLKTCMLMMFPGNGFSERYFVASFINGLSEEDLKSSLNLCAPASLQRAIQLGYCLIQALALPIKRLTAQEMAARMEKDLCYSCDDVYVSGHRCKQRVRYAVMTEEEELALLPLPAPSAARLLGEANGHALHILIASASSLSFIQESTALKLGCKVEVVKPFLVEDACGQKLVSTKRAHGFRWKVQNHEFTFSPRLLEIEFDGYDLNLGGDWLRVCSPIEFDFGNRTVAVTWNGDEVKMQLHTPTSITAPSVYVFTHSEM